MTLAACPRPAEEVDLPVVDQDIDPTESPIADRAIEILLGHDNVEMVFARRNDRYEAHARDGRAVFARTRGTDRYEYPVIAVDGRNPLEFQDPTALPDIASELGAGDNPEGTDYRALDAGYRGPTDPRISFLRSDAVSYPLAYERIAALFDGEHAGDLVVEFTPWGWFPLGKREGADIPGAHGQLNNIASRAPLIFAGRGASVGITVNDFARSVDIAPTVARAMGIATTTGVDEVGRMSEANLLRWQDGHPLDDVLDGEVATYVVIVVNDALTQSELMDRLAGDDPLTAYRWMVDNGALYAYGAVTNFPSNTFASHNTIGTGAYSGHHGLIDNWFFDRVENERHDPLTEIFDTGRFLSDRVETLHEAVHRSFPNWHPDRNPAGNFTLAINTPATRGADHALLEGVRPIDWDECPEPAIELPPSDPSISERSQGADNLAVTTFVKAVLGTRELDGRRVRCTHPPRLTIINLGLTDDVAHETGPHSDSMRTAIRQTDARMQIMIDALREAGMLADTLFVLTADHGQCLQDTKRVKDFKPALEAAQIRFQATNAFIYLSGGS
jgi:hypothetical protein